MPDSPKPATEKCPACGSPNRKHRNFVNPRDRCPDPWHSAPAQPDPGEEAPEAIALRYGFAVYDESAPNHLRVNKTAVEMLEAYTASLRSEVAQLERKNELLVQTIEQLRNDLVRYRLLASDRS